MKKQFLSLLNYQCRYFQHRWTKCWVQLWIQLSSAGERCKETWRDKAFPLKYTQTDFVFTCSVVAGETVCETYVWFVLWSFSESVWLLCVHTRPAFIFFGSEHIGVYVHVCNKMWSRLECRKCILKTQRNWATSETSDSFEDCTVLMENCKSLQCSKIQSHCYLTTQHVTGGLLYFDKNR